MTLSEKAEKKRITVTMTKHYIDALDGIVEKGIYMTRSDVVLEILRRFFKSRGIEPFSSKDIEQLDIELDPDKENSPDKV